MSRFFALALAAAAAVLMAAVPLQAAESNAYTVTPLVSDQATLAGPPDTTLVNAWGLVAGLTANGSTPWWVVDNGTNASTLYTNTGAKQALTVGVAGGPTGIVFNAAGAGFPVAGAERRSSSSTTRPGRSWPGAAGSQRRRSSTTARWTARSTRGSPSHDAERCALYATDFHNGRVDVFDSTWTRSCSRARSSIRASRRLRAVRHPGDRRAASSSRTRSRTRTGRTRSPARARLRRRVRHATAPARARVAQHGQLNAPWGLALGAGRFGRFGGDLLVGNFGDGQINAYEPQANGEFAHRGELTRATAGTSRSTASGRSSSGNGGRSGPTNTLFFTAGPDDESHGLFGSITAG